MPNKNKGKLTFVNIYSLKGWLWGQRFRLLAKIFNHLRLMVCQKTRKFDCCWVLCNKPRSKVGD